MKDGIYIETIAEVKGRIVSLGILLAEYEVFLQKEEMDRRKRKVWTSKKRKKRRDKTPRRTQSWRGNRGSRKRKDSIASS